MTVDQGRSLAALAALLAEPTRASICLTLLDGRAWTSGELAQAAKIAPSTASEHLTRLVTAGLLTEHRQGRHRYLRLADPQIAQLIEDLAGHAPPATPAPRSLRAATTHSALAHARTCYDHLAGRLGVLVTDALVTRDLVQYRTGLAVTEAGLDWLAHLGIDVPALRRTRRPLLRHCLDWTERRPHLAGAAAAALCRHMFDADWITRVGTGRAVRVTTTGRHALADTLGLDPTDLDPPPRRETGGGRA